jgi:hypothetical protein
MDHLLMRTREGTYLLSGYIEVRDRSHPRPWLFVQTGGDRMPEDLHGQIHEAIFHTRLGHGQVALSGPDGLATVVGMTALTDL